MEQTSFAEDAHEALVDEDVFTAQFAEFQDADSFELVEIARRGLAFDLELFGQELDLAIRMHEEKLNQFFRVNLRSAILDQTDGLVQKRANPFDLPDRGAGCFLNPLQQVYNPFFPFAGLRNRAEEFVIARLVFDDIRTQIQDRDIEISFEDEIEHVDDAPRSAVAVVKRMNLLELIMKNRYLRHGSVLIIEVFREILQQSAYRLFAFRRRIDGNTGSVVLQGGSGRCSDSRVVFNYDRLNIDNVVYRKETSFLDHPETRIERFPVEHNLFG